ncbi:hypothetical protein HDU97_000003 [Phlyctochytrium planicorne]|nr:hypothetical protein HDU97_000003 [Phlyctochytrium planicorne]
MAATVELPVIDISSFFTSSSTSGEASAAAADASASSTSSSTHIRTDDARSRAAREMIEACEQWGAFQVVGHPITPQQLEKAYDAAVSIFGLPIDVKSAIPIKPGGFTRGYVGVGGESGSAALEVKEAFSYGYDWPASKPPTNPLEGPNLWPSNLNPAARASLERYYTLSVSVAESISQCLSLALNSPALVTACKGGETIGLMRVFKYFPYEKGGKEDETFQPDVDRIGSSPHTDWGYLTLISSKKPGLQIAKKQANGTTQWVTVKPVENAFIVNAGDYLSLVSNGLIKSPLHRVVTAVEERLSFVFFYYPNYNAKLEFGGGSVGGGSVEGGEHLDKLSLFKDQRAVAQSTTEEEDKKSKSDQLSSLATKTFGQYISEKWASVFRDASGSNGGPIKSY